MPSTGMKDDDTKTSHVCKRCGKLIAEILAKDAECCACRYGVMASDDHGHVIDCVEWMSGRAIGYRLAVIGAFDLWMEGRPNLGHNVDD